MIETFQKSGLAAVMGVQLAMLVWSGVILCSVVLWSVTILQPVVVGHAAHVVGHAAPVVGHAALVVGHAALVVGHAAPVADVEAAGRVSDCRKYLPHTAKGREDSGARMKTS